MADPTQSRIDVLENKFRINKRTLTFAQLADLYRKQGNIQKAIEICQQGIALHPYSISGRTILGRCFLEQENYDAATTEFMQTLQLDNRNHVVVKLLADLYLKQELKEKAGDLYSCLYTMDQGNDSFKQLSAKYPGSGKSDLYLILGTSAIDQDTQFPKGHSSADGDTLTFDSGDTPQHAADVEEISLADTQNQTPSINETIGDLPESSADMGSRMEMMFGDQSAGQVSASSQPETEIWQTASASAEVPFSADFSDPPSTDDVASRIDALFGTPSFDAETTKQPIAADIPTSPSAQFNSIEMGDTIAFDTPLARANPINELPTPSLRPTANNNFEDTSIWTIDDTSDSLIVAQDVSQPENPPVEEPKSRGASRTLDMNDTRVIQFGTVRKAAEAALKDQQAREQLNMSPDDVSNRLDEMFGTESADGEVAGGGEITEEAVGEGTEVTDSEVFESIVDNQSEAFIDDQTQVEALPQSNTDQDSTIAINLSEYRGMLETRTDPLNPEGDILPGHEDMVTEQTILSLDRSSFGDLAHGPNPFDDLAATVELPLDAIELHGDQLTTPDIAEEDLPFSGGAHHVAQSNIDKFSDTNYSGYPGLLGDEPDVDPNADIVVAGVPHQYRPGNEFAHEDTTFSGLSLDNTVSSEDDTSIPSISMTDTKVMIFQEVDGKRDPVVTDIFGDADTLSDELVDIQPDVAGVTDLDTGYADVEEFHDSPGISGDDVMAKLSSIFQTEDSANGSDMSFMASALPDDEEAVDVGLGFYNLSGDDAEKASTEQELIDRLDESEIDTTFEDVAENLPTPLPPATDMSEIPGFELPDRKQSALRFSDLMDNSKAPVLSNGLNHPPADAESDTGNSPASDQPATQEFTVPDSLAGSLSHIPDHVLTPTLADIYFQQGQVELAISIYTRLFERDPRNEKIALKLAQTKRAYAAQLTEDVRRIEESILITGSPTGVAPTIRRQIKKNVVQQPIPEAVSVVAIPTLIVKPKKNAPSTPRKSAKDEAETKPLSGVRIKKKFRQIAKKRTARKKSS